MVAYLPVLLLFWSTFLGALTKEGQYLKHPYSQRDELLSLSSSQETENFKFNLAGHFSAAHFSKEGRVEGERLHMMGDVHYLYDDLVAHEGEKVLYLYEPDSHRPALQLRTGTDGAIEQIYYYQLDHLGTPQELTDSRGEVVWRASYRGCKGEWRKLYSIPHTLSGAVL